MSTLVIKLQYENDLRRFTIHYNASFSYLQAIILSLFPSLTDFSLTYRDNDNDVISITNDKDLIEAIRLSSNNILRLFMKSAPLLDSSWCVLSDPNSQPSHSINPPRASDPKKIEEILSRNQKSSAEIKPVSSQDQRIYVKSSPAPTPKNSEICKLISQETRQSCLQISDETMASTKQLFQNSVEGCNYYSALTRDMCNFESAEIMKTTKGIPSSIVNMSNDLSKQTLSNCHVASNQTLASCRIEPSSLEEKMMMETMKQTCSDLSDQTSRECRDISASIAAQIMSL
eukprot:TRINITY_DN7665_c0_g1_i1.p1 TRINITY_DN7665_c0_g1~~TRINITY_DN7665_c0_g1_i1.p1  ORF type:complete len:287 (-),score=55.44 TRINITY_DN7665_c0_g1_i1:87-947(-)